MTWPIWYGGQILFTDGALAMSEDCCCGDCPPSSWQPCLTEFSDNVGEKCNNASIAGSSWPFFTSFTLDVSQDCPPGNSWTVELVSITNGTIHKSDGLDQNDLPGTCPGAFGVENLNSANGLSVTCCYETGDEVFEDTLETFVFRFTHDQSGVSKLLTVTVLVSPGA